MNIRALAPVIIVAATACLAIVGCQRKTVVVTISDPTPLPVGEPIAKTKTLETIRLGAAVDAYEREPNAERQAGVKKARAALDGEIAELEALVAKRTGEDRAEAATKLQNLQAYRTAEMARFAAAQAKAPLTADPLPRDGRTGADKIGDAIKHVGEKVEDAAHQTRDAIKNGDR